MLQNLDTGRLKDLTLTNVVFEYDVDGEEGKIFDI